MLALIGGGAWAALVLYLLARALRQFGAYRAARLSPARLLDAPRAVAVVVPVRNEIANIGPCLAGLSAQSGLSERLTITVVDDGSDDGTTAAAARAADADDRIKVIDAGPLPSGWAGKPHACWRGAAAAAAPWLCFVDADVRAEPGLLAAALTAAAALDADLLSLHPRQELGSFWERVIIPAGLLSLACAKRFDPASADVVNGQVLLVRRDAYFRVGGHAAVRAEICEDKALALRMREAGFSLRVLSAEDFAATRMYRGLRSLWQGFSKNAADALGGIGATLVAAIALLLFAAAAVLLPLASLAIAASDPSAAAVSGSALALIGTAIVIAVDCGTARHLRIPAAYGATCVLGFVTVACLACSGVGVQLFGQVTWKGRTYRLGKASASRT